MFTPTSRAQLDRRPHPRVDAHYAGGLPPKLGAAPHLRAGRGKWFNLLWLIPIGFVLLVVGVAVAKGLRNMRAVESFLSRYPGTSHLPPGTPTGFPAWLNWQHLLNLFFMVSPPP